MLNQDCARDLLKAIDTGLTSSHKRGWKLRFHLQDPELAPYMREEILVAAKYLYERSFFMLSHSDSAPHYYCVKDLTAKGHDYLLAIKNDAVWKKLCRRFGRVFDATLPELFAAAASCGADLLFR